jgi:hypothetical protein
MLIIIVKIYIKKIPITTHFIKLIIFFVALFSYDIFIRFGFLGNIRLSNINIDSVVSYISEMLRTFGVLIIGYYSFFYIIDEKRKDIEKILFISLFLGNLFLLLFLLNNVPIGTRLITITSLFDINTLAFTNIDPNFYIYNGLALSLLFIRNNNLIVFLLLEFVILNVLYFNSLTGYILIFVTIINLIPQKKILLKFVIIFLLIIISIKFGDFALLMKYKNSIDFIKYGGFTYENLNILLTGRLEIWRAYIHLIEDYPLGKGINYAWNFTGKYIIVNSLKKVFAHNLFLQILADHGIIFGSLFLIYYLKNFVKIYKFRRIERRIYTSFLILLITGLTLSNNYSVPFYFILSLFTIIKLSPDNLIKNE